MPIKDKAKYNKYMKDYMKGRSRAVKKVKKKDDFNAVEDNTIIDIPQEDNDGKIDFSKVLEKTEELTKDKVTGEKDPIFKYLKMAEKFAPMIGQFLKGFSDNMKANNLNQMRQVQQAQQLTNTINAPAGWLEKNRMERLKFKFSRPEWYEAGLKYEGEASNNPQQVQETRQQPQQINQIQEPSNLNELKNKHPEPPLDTGEVPKQNNENQEQEITEVEKIKMVLAEDNKKYLGIAINYLKSLDDKDFIKKLKNLDDLKNSFALFSNFIPISVKEMLKHSETEEFINLFKTECPEKYKIVEDKKKLDELKGLFEELKKSL